MAEAREVTTEAISVQNVSPIGHRGFHDAAGALIMLKPGEEISDVQVASPVAENMRQWSTDGTTDIVVSGSTPASQGKKSDEKELSREEVYELERKNLQEAMKKSGNQPPLSDVPQVQNNQLSEMAKRGQTLESSGQSSSSGQSASQAASSQPKLSRTDMDGMTKAELAEHAQSLGVDVPSSATKQDVIDAIVKGQRR